MGCKFNIFCSNRTPIPLELPAKYVITTKRRSSERHCGPDLHISLVADLEALAHGHWGKCIGTNTLGYGREEVDKAAICCYHCWHDWYLSVNLGENDALAGHLLPGLDPAVVGNSIYT